jgi:hypothetical protein
MVSAEPTAGLGPGGGGVVHHVDNTRGSCERHPPRHNHNHAVKVLSVGLPRTGSKSMLRALEVLGYRNVHHLGQIWWQPREWAFLDRAADASFPSLGLSTHAHTHTHTQGPGSGSDAGAVPNPVDWDVMFGDNEAITDAAGTFAPQLIEAYPNAKCIMVMRDFDAWARSVDETLLSYLFSWFKCPPCPPDPLPRVFNATYLSTVHPCPHFMVCDLYFGSSSTSTHIYTLSFFLAFLFFFLLLKLTPTTDGWLSACLIDPLVGAYSTRAMRKMFMGAMRCRAGEARNKEVLRRFYDNHCATVRAMVPPDRLCVMRLGDGWEPLVSGPYPLQVPVALFLNSFFFFG